MNQDEIIAELIKLNTQAFITIDAISKVVNELHPENLDESDFLISGLLNDFQELHCNIEENLIELVKVEKI